MPTDSPQDHTPPREREGAERRYALDDLTSAAGVTPRTVRYYIAEGLLPPPLGAGPGNHYTRAHLDRLLLIGQLKEQYLPLKEIRRELQQMTDGQVHDTIELVHGSSQIPSMESSSAPLRAAIPEDGDARMSSAEDYISGLLHAPGRGRPAMRRGTIRPIDLPSGQPDTSSEGSREASPEGSRWRRVAVTPEAELLIDEETWRRRRAQIESVIAYARRVLE